jgi:hypothetical protein
MNGNADVVPAVAILFLKPAAVPFDLSDHGNLLLAAVSAAVGPDTEWYVAVSYMEVCRHSGSLADVILHRPLAWQEKLRVILKAAECVFTVHACGVTHRYGWGHKVPRALAGTLWLA